MKWILIACSLIMMWLDYRAAVRRVPADKQSTLYRIVAILWFLDLMIFLYDGITKLFWNDNPTWMAMASMWLNYAYMTLVIARGPLMLALAFTRSTILRLLGAMIWIWAAALFAYSTFTTRTDYVVNNITIHSENLPESFDGYRILQLSDLHIGSMVDPEREITEIVDICNQQTFDMIAFTGDLIDIRHSEITPTIKSTLQRLYAPNGIFAVTGNHDRGVYVRDSLTITTAYTTAQLLATERAMGWCVLDNCSTYIHRGNDSISITGISFSPALQEQRHSSKIDDVDFAEAYTAVTSGFNITLSHIPQLWDSSLKKHRADVTLSGHVHAMQMKFPLGKRFISPSMLTYKRWSGLYEEHGHWLYINDGIGCSMYPMRIGAQPEITIIELRRR